MENYRVPAGAGIGHVHLKVSDIERALAFYTGVLGFDRIQRLGDHAAFYLGRWLPSPHRPEYLAEPARTPRTFPPHRPLPFRHPLSDAPRSRARRPRVVSAGVPLRASPITASANPSTSATPDGNGIELT
jgi:catechol 2,3-dioxygenase